MKRGISSYKSVSNSRYPDNSVGAIDAYIDRADKTDIADSFLNIVDLLDGNGKTVGLINTVTLTLEAADLASCGSTPVVLLSALGANITHPVIGVSVKFVYGTTAYDFESVVLKNSGSSVFNFFMNDDLNAGADFYKFYTRQGNDELANANFVLTTEDSSDPSQGDGELIIKLYYRIDDFNP